MEIILILLTGTLMGAFNFGFFCLGYYVRGKKNDDKVEITEDNKDAIKEIMDWLGYGGKK